MAKIFWWCAVASGLGGFVLLAQGGFFTAILAFMDKHEGTAGWLQAIFSVLAISITSYYALAIPRETRRSEKLDREAQGIDQAISIFASIAGILTALKSALEEDLAPSQMIKTFRIEILQRLSDIARLPPEAIPRNAIGLLAAVRAQARNCTLALHDLEMGVVSIKAFDLKAMQFTINGLDALLIMLHQRHDEIGKVSRNVHAGSYEEVERYSPFTHRYEKAVEIRR